MTRRRFPLVSGTMVVFIFAAIVCFSRPAAGAITIVGSRVGNDVMFEWGGPGQSIDLTGLGVGPVTEVPSDVDPIVAIYPRGVGFSVRVPSEDVTPIGIPLGDSGNFFGSGFGLVSGGEFVGADAVTVAGSPLTILGLPYFEVPRGYVSGSTYPAGSAIIHGTSFPELGIDTSQPHTLVTFNNGDRITMEFDLIPEPSAGLLVLGSVVLLGCSRRRL